VTNRLDLIARRVRAHTRGIGPAGKKGRSAFIRYPSVAALADASTTPPAPAQQHNHYRFLSNNPSKSRNCKSTGDVLRSAARLTFSSTSEFMLYISSDPSAIWM
jgi:hypothetical protein